MIANHDHSERWDASDVSALETMYHDEDRSIEYIAAHMGRTKKAVKSALYRNNIKRR